ncbi:MAG TPA: hypothetical protein V6C69_15070 [Trichormus sp.]
MAGVEVTVALLVEPVQRSFGQTKPVYVPSKRIFSSSAAFALIAYTFANIACVVFNPIRYIDPLGWTGIRQNYLVSKLPQIIEAKSGTGILLLGSSLSLTPAIRCDDALAHRRERVDPWYMQIYLSHYSKAVYLQTALSKLLKHPIDLQNASVPASVVSDQSLIFRRYLETNKVPGCAVVCTAPRDYIDPNAQADRTAVYQLLATRKDLLIGNSRPHRIFSNRNLENLCMYSSGLYRHRSEYSTVFVQYWIQAANFLGCETFGKSWRKIESSFREPPKDTPEYIDSRPSPANHDASSYRPMYSPIKVEQYNCQIAALRELCLLGKQRHVPVIVVEMPLSNENLALLSKDFKKKLYSDIEKTANENGAIVYKPTTEIRFEHDDFEDSAHMGTGGAFKFFNWLAAKLAQEKIAWPAK